MKQPKKLTRYQKEILTKKGIDERAFMLMDEDKDTFTVIAKHPNEHGIKEQMTFAKS